MTTPVLAIRDLAISLPRGADRDYAVQNIDFDLNSGEILCVVGESGSGKSMTANALMGLLPDQVEVAKGSAEFEGRDLLALPDNERRKLRGARIGMIFQEPMTALNPLMRIGDQIAEVFEAHNLHTTSERREKALALIREVGLPDPEKIIRAYPFQLSGGQRQRAMIAMALALDPAILIADEPTTALDVTVQAQILSLLDDLRRERGLAIIFITHDFGVVAQLCDRMAVMYAGRIVEEGPTGSVLSHPLHPYTRRLIACVPELGEGRRELAAIPGLPPVVDDLPPGCAFAPRCSRAADACREAVPETVEPAPGRRSACLEAEALAKEGGAK